MKILLALLILSFASTIQAASGTLSSADNPCELASGETTCDVTLVYQKSNANWGCVWRVVNPALIACTQSNFQQSKVWPWTNEAGQQLELRAHSSLPSSNASGYASGQLLDSLFVQAVQPTPFGNFKVGVNYHATNADFSSSSFLTKYNQSSVRNTVLTQLQQMANSGAKIIRTEFWLSLDVNASSSATWRHHFPPSNQEILNLAQYVQDVSQVQLPNGGYFEFELNMILQSASAFNEFNSNGCIYPADTSCEINANTLIGPVGYTPAQYTTKLVQTYTSVIDATSNITKPNGTKAVDSIIFHGEIRLGHKLVKGYEWLMKTHYSGFVNYAEQHGLNASIDFNPGGTESQILDAGYVDSQYPILNGHRSAFWMYRTIKFLQDNNLPVPARIDFSFYPWPINSDFQVITQRVLDDMGATLPSLGLPAPIIYGIAETYPMEGTALDADRAELSAAYLEQASDLNSNRLSRVLLWSTPFSQTGNPFGSTVGMPTEIVDFLPPP